MLPVKPSDIPNSRQVFLSVDQLGYYGTVIQTDHGSIQASLQVPMSDAKRVLPQVKQALDKLDLDIVYQDKAKWTRFCNDVVLYYGLLHRITKTPIPIMPACFARLVCTNVCIRCAKPNATKYCGKCGVLYCNIDCQRADWMMHKHECMNKDCQPKLQKESKRPQLSMELPPGIDLNEDSYFTVDA